MPSDFYSFLAKDAFVYVDTYRKLKLEETNYIARQKERLVEKFWNMSQQPTQYFAELRACEHALQYALERKEPGLVVLGEYEGEEPAQGGMQAIFTKRLEEKDGQIRQMREELEKVREEIKRYKEFNHEAQAEIIKKNQSIARLRRRLGQTNSTFAVVGVVMVMVIIVLLLLYFSRAA